MQIAYFRGNEAMEVLQHLLSLLKVVLQNMLRNLNSPTITLNFFSLNDKFRHTFLKYYVIEC